MSEPIDFEGIFICTVSSSHRKNFLFATLWSLLSQIKNATWLIELDDYMMIENEYEIRALAENNDNHIVVGSSTYVSKDEKSLGNMRAELFRNANESCSPRQPCILKLDDDYAIPYETLKQIAASSSHREFSHCFPTLDVYNSAKHVDWDVKPKHVSDMMKHVQSYGIDSINHQRWIGLANNIVVEQLTSLCLLNLSHESLHELCDKLRKLKRGERGEDMIIKKHVKEFLLHPTHYAWHMGVHDHEKHWQTETPDLTVQRLKTKAHVEGKR